MEQTTQVVKIEDWLNNNHLKTKEGISTWIDFEGGVEDLANLISTNLEISIGKVAILFALALKHKLTINEGLFIKENNFQDLIDEIISSDDLLGFNLGDYENFISKYLPRYRMEA